MPKAAGKPKKIIDTAVENFSDSNQDAERKNDINNFSEWTNKYFRKTENNFGYKSEAVFVPASVLIADINKQMAGGD